MSETHSSLSGGLPFWTKEMLEKFCSKAVHVSYKKGDTILHPLMTNQFLFLVESGIVDHRYFSKDGDAMTILQVRPGEFFGLKAFFEPGEESDRRYFFVVADTDVTLWKISRDQLLSLMKADFAFTTSITEYFIRIITTTEKKIMRSAILDNYQNMVLTLLDYAENVTDNTAVVRVTQQNLADLLTLSRQSVSSYLSSMVRQGLISVKRGKIYILDWNALNMELL